MLYRLSLEHHAVCLQSVFCSILMESSWILFSSIQSVLCLNFGFPAIHLTAFRTSFFRLKPNGITVNVPLQGVL